MKYLFLTALALLAVACTKPQPSALIDQAELALANDDAEAARSCCDELSQMEGVTLTPSVLCRQALVYAQLADGNDELQDMAAATKCLDQALSISVDSVNEFYESIDIEQRAQLNLVKCLTQPSEDEIDLND